MRQNKKIGIGKKFVVIFFILFFIFVFPQNGFSQKSPCSKPIVVVKLTDFFDNTFDHLNKQYSPRLKEEWKIAIQVKVLEELNKNSPGTQFIPDGADNCDYNFSYSLAIIGAGEDKEIHGLKVSEYTAYWMQSKLVGENQCEFPGQILDVEITKDDKDIYYTIRRNIAAFGNIGERIEEFETSHPVPPRGPEMVLSHDKEYVSPLKDEKELKIKIDVTNCKGEAVYDKYHGQKVILPRKTKRGEIKPTKGFPQEFLVTDNLVTLIIVRPVGASATYTLKRGVKPDLETINILTCGRDKRVVKETKIQIKSLEINVTPERKKINPGEKTNIEIKLSKVDTKGQKEPLAGKKIQLNIKGLINGKVTPSSDIVTDEDGIANLIYRAGEQDSSVSFFAKYQPPDFPDFVEDKGRVRIIRGADVEATLKATFHSKYHHHTREGRNTSDSETQIFYEVAVEALFEYHKTYSNRKTGEYSEKYRLKSWEIVHSSAWIDAESHSIIRDDRGISNERHTTEKAKGKAEKSDDTSTLDISFDGKTRKAVTVNFPGFSVNINGKDKIKTVSKVREGAGYRISTSEESPEWRYYFRPIWAPFEDFMKVRSGDGKNSISGKGTHVFKTNKEHEQSLSVEWNIKRKKKE